MTGAGASSIFILNVGVDPSLLRSRTLLLQSKGYNVETAYSIDDAFLHFQAGDFDLILLCHSISQEDRKRLISRIRSYGSAIPVIYVAAAAAPGSDPFATRTAGSSPDPFLSVVDAVLQQIHPA